MVFGKSSKGAELTHNIGNVMVKSCQESPYLGTIMTPSNSMWGFLKEVDTQNGGKASTIIKFFNSLVTPVLLYNSEIWESFLKVESLHNFTKFKDHLFDESHKHEQLLNRLCKYTLGIPKKSSNIAAKGELGIYHLNIEISVRINY